jgi:hypothetical protein
MLSFGARASRTHDPAGAPTPSGILLLAISTSFSTLFELGDDMSLLLR